MVELLSVSQRLFCYQLHMPPRFSALWFPKSETVWVSRTSLHFTNFAVSSWLLIVWWQLVIYLNFLCLAKSKLTLHPTGAGMIYINGNPNGLCLLNLASFLYVAFFAPLTFIVFLNPLFHSNQPTLMFTYKAQVRDNFGLNLIKKGKICSFFLAGWHRWGRWRSDEQCSWITSIFSH